MQGRHFIADCAYFLVLQSMANHTSGGYHEHMGGYHEYIRRCSVHRGIFMMHVGEQVDKILSIYI